MNISQEPDNNPQDKEVAGKQESKGHQYHTLHTPTSPIMNPPEWRS